MYLNLSFILVTLSQSTMSVADDSSLRREKEEKIKKSELNQINK